MKFTIPVFRAATILVALALASAAPAAETRLLNVSYDPTRELYTLYNDLFAKAWKARTGDDVRIEQSHGGSGKQARSVIDGLNADVVTLALGWDINAIQRAGLIDPGWEKKLPYNSSPYTSTIAFLVRKGNPKNIRDWGDLLKPGVQAVAPNPKTGGGARWVFLAIWGGLAKAPTHDLSSARGQAEAGAASAKTFPVYDNAEVEAKVAEIYRAHIPVLDSAARGSTVTFAQKQIGDVLLNWENELWLARDEFGADKFEIVYPSSSILTEPPVAVVDRVVDRNNTRAVAEAYLQGLYTPEAQDIIGQLNYRPRNAEALKKFSADLPNIPLFTIDETFGGWDKAQKAFFGDGGAFDRIFQPAK